MTMIHKLVCIHISPFPSPSPSPPPLPFPSLLIFHRVASPLIAYQILGLRTGEADIDNVYSRPPVGEMGLPSSIESPYGDGSGYVGGACGGCGHESISNQAHLIHHLRQGDMADKRAIIC